MQITPERRKLLWAIVASLVLHFAVGISIASFGDKLQPSLPEEEKPVEMTIVDLAPAPTPSLVPKNAPFIDTPEQKESKDEPKEKTFESNANSIGASQLPALGNAPVPTQDGRDRPDMDMENQQHALALNGAQPQPEVRPSSTQTPPPPEKTPTPAPSASATPTTQPTITPTPSATPSPTPEPSATANPELLAMFRATPPPSIRAPQDSESSPTPETSTPPSTARPTPPPQQPPASSYQREQTQTRMRGNISNRGISSVNAIGTPLGRYQKRVTDAIGSRWYGLIDQNRDRVNIGTVHVEFYVDRSGHVTKVKILENTSAASFTNLCLESVQDAKMPPIPEDLAATLPSEGLPEEMTFTIYPN